MSTPHAQLIHLLTEPPPADHPDVSSRTNITLTLQRPLLRKLIELAELAEELSLICYPVGQWVGWTSLQRCKRILPILSRIWIIIHR